MMTGLGHPHRRMNPLTGRWVLISAGRTDRPWRGRVEASAPAARPAYDPKCHLCPGNQRANGARNPDFTGTFVFTNDFSALREDTPALDLSDHPLLQAHTMPGTCRVLCFSSRHDVDLAEMETDEISEVVEMWFQQYGELEPLYRWVQIFENRGAMMGASNPHPHGQLWASEVLPDEPAAEDRAQRSHYDKNGSPLLLDYGGLEADRGTRVVAANADWIAIVPYWAVWPFETLVVPTRHVPRFTALTPTERTSLANLLRVLLVSYDNLFHHPFPYSMGWHGAPGHEGDDRHWQLHAHFYPPLLRSATVRKFMVGYEMLADVGRDLTPEDAAERLREQSDVHYRAGGRRNSELQH